MQQFYDGEKEQLEFFFHITNSSNYAQIDLEATSHGDIEIDVCDFIDTAQEHILPAFLATVDIQQHIDNNEPVSFYSELPDTPTEPQI